MEFRSIRDTFGKLQVYEKAVDESWVDVIVYYCFFQEIEKKLRIIEKSRESY
jgi:hypothetical protein